MSSESVSSPPRPNILYIHSHDTGRYIQPYGYAVPTPNLQKLAEEGVLFRQAYCANPTCSPSRAALLTGQAAHSSGMFGLAHRGWALSDYSQHIIHTLHAQGYTSALAGVQHIANHDAGEPWKTIGYHQHLGDPGEAHERAADFLRNPPQKPFFLAVGFGQTHREFPDLPDDELARYVKVPDPLPDTPEVRKDMAEYILCAQDLDARMGAVFQALDESPQLRENTLIICTTDHGLAFPFMKCNLNDSGIGIMLLMRGPGGFEGGKVSDALVSHIDIFPTICDLLRISVPHWVQGKSILPLMLGEKRAVNEQIFAEVNYHAAYEPQRCIRTDRYKLIRRYDTRERPILPNCDNGFSKLFLYENGWLDQPRPQEMLYDLYFDPNEKDNRIDDPQLSDVKTDLQTRLDYWMRETNDPLFHDGKLPEAPPEMVTDPDALAPRGKSLSPKGR